MITDYKVLTANSAPDLNKKVKEAMVEGFIPVGSHKVITRNTQNQFAGMQHRSSKNDNEYSQTVIKE